jgi:hypothetical protein
MNPDVNSYEYLVAQWGWDKREKEIARRRSRDSQIKRKDTKKIGKR